MNHFIKKSSTLLVQSAVLSIFIFIFTGLIQAASLEKEKKSAISTKTDQVINIKKSTVKKPAPEVIIKTKGIKKYVPLPDLVITNVEMSQNCKVKYTLKNNSKIKIKNSVHAKGSLKIRITGKPSRTIILPFAKVDRKGLLKRAFGTLTATSAIEIKGTSFVTLTIDSGNQIPESNEGNNVSRRTRMVNNCKAVKRSMPAMTVRGKNLEISSPKKPVVPMISENNNTARTTTSRSNSMAANRLEPDAETRRDPYNDHGINITLPEAGEVFNHRDIINVQYSVTGDLDPGVISFRLLRDGEIVEMKTRSYTPSATGTESPEIESFEWRIPWSTPAGSYYYIYAERPLTSTVYGFSHIFEIKSVDIPAPFIPEVERLELPINIFAPVGNDKVVLGDTTQIRWGMPESDSEVNCGDRVRVFAVEEGSDHKILLEARWAQPGDNSFTWFVNPDTFHFGRYQIYIETSEGCRIRGAAFEITGCDYAIESVTFLDGRPLTAGVDARSGSIIHGGFRVKIRWNKIELPSSFAPGTAWGNLMKVRSTITGEIINVPASGINFDYTDVSTTSGGRSLNDIIYLNVPFEFERDDIAGMVTGSRNIPLEFSFETTGASTDSNGANNTLNVNMKVLDLKIVDFQISVNSGGFTLSRDVHWPGSAPIYDYHFIQNVIGMRNLATTAAGSPPADILNVPVKWYIEWRPAGGNWSEAPLSHGNFNFSVVSADWGHSMGVGGDFSTIINDPGRTYRLRLVVDPDHEYLDSNRSNNTRIVIFGNPD